MFQRTLKIKLLPGDIQLPYLIYVVLSIELISRSVCVVISIIFILLFEEFIYNLLEYDIHYIHARKLCCLFRQCFLFLKYVPRCCLRCTVTQCTCSFKQRIYFKCIVCISGSITWLTLCPLCRHMSRASVDVSVWSNAG